LKTREREDTTPLTVTHAFTTTTYWFICRHILWYCRNL